MDLLVLDSSYAWDHTVFILLGLISFSIMSSSFIHVIAGARTSFLFMTKYHSIVWMEHIWFIHSSADGRLGCFHILAVVNNPAVHVCVQVFVWTYVFISLGYVSSSATSGSRVTLCITSWETAKLLPGVAAPFYILLSSVWGLRFLHTSPVLVIIWLFDSSHPSWCEVVFFIRISLMTNDVEHLFMGLLAIYLSSWELEKCLFRFFVHF